jgi:hypothetical protein
MQIEKVQKNNSDFLKQTVTGPFHSRKNSTSGKLEKSGASHRPKVSDIEEFRPVEIGSTSKLPVIPPPKLGMAYEKVSLYQLPNKGLFVQSVLKKRDTRNLTQFKSLMQSKVANISKMVSQEIEMIPELRGNIILKLRLAVVHVTGQMAYLERMFTIRSLTDCYLKVYLKADRYSYGFSPENNKLLVSRIIGFLSEVNSKILIMRCKDELGVLEKFSAMKDYVRYDCSEITDVYVLNSSEAKVVDFLFFQFLPDFQAKDKQLELLISGDQRTDESLIEVPEPEFSEPGKKEEISEPDLMEEILDVQPKLEPETTVQKSKWMIMIERCLRRKDILKMNQDDFAEIFSQFAPNHDEKSEPKAEKKEANDVKESRTLENMRRFKNLLSYQIQEDRNQRTASLYRYEH